MNCGLSTSVCEQLTEANKYSVLHNKTFKQQTDSSVSIEHTGQGATHFVNFKLSQ